MKQLIILFSLGLLMPVLNSCESTTTHNHEMHTATVDYSCPMHPEVTSDKPGSCPKCGMDLVKKEPTK